MVGNNNLIELFIHQEPVTDEFLLSLSAGQISKTNDRFIVAFQQLGAESTFSIGQPLYDSENNLLGYLEIGLWKNLDVYVENKEFHNENIPSYYWAIGKPTKFCEEGKRIYTYWQLWK